MIVGDLLRGVLRKCTTLTTYETSLKTVLAVVDDAGKQAKHAMVVTDAACTCSALSRGHQVSSLVGFGFRAYAEHS